MIQKYWTSTVIFIEFFFFNVGVFCIHINTSPVHRYLLEATSRVNPHTDYSILSLKASEEVRHLSTTLKARVFSLSKVQKGVDSERVYFASVSSSLFLVRK